MVDEYFVLNESISKHDQRFEIEKDAKIDLKQKFEVFKNQVHGAIK